jgi:anaerobic ribonucleoside-triphosphate reductase activating protein
MPLRLAHTIPNTQAEGPGNRFAIWVQGCSIQCEGCCNPELFAFMGGRTTEPEVLVERILDTPDIEGISFLGGEPFDQPAPLLQVIQGLQDKGLSTMIYSGYTLEELIQRDNPSINAILAQTDLLVDGRFDQSKPETQRRWLGSTNQKLHFLTERYSPLEPQFWSSNTVEIRFDGDHIQVNGWPLGDLLTSTASASVDETPISSHHPRA